MDIQQELRKLRDYRQLLELKYRYCWALDADDADGYASVFTEDGVLTARRFSESEPNVRREGREDLRDLIRERRETLDYTAAQHRPYNPVIELDRDEATGKWYFTSVAERGDGTVEFEFGEYHEAYRRVDGSWGISRSRVRYTTMQPVLQP
ncbi:MAG: nuclear transport factor 2 family protein [Halovenus sp.]